MSDISHTEEVKKPRKAGKIMHTVWVSIEYVAFHFSEAVGDNLRVMRKEINLFLGTALSLFGLLNWSSGKYCDGNTADYLSCTRPNTYYYYGWFQITLIVIGVMLVLVWYVKHRQSK